MSKEQLSDDGFECILYGELYTKYTPGPIDQIISKTNLIPANAVYSEKNDIILPSSGESNLDISTACCLQKDKVILGGDLNIIRSNQHDGSFICYELIGKRKYDIAKIAQGASIVHLHNSDLEKLKLFVPCDKDEELKITSLLNLINARITTQKKIICLLESQINQIRKTFLDKLEKENSYILLGDIIEEYNKKTTINDMYPILSSTKSGIHLQSEYFNKEAASDDTTGYKIVPKGYCTYRSMSDTGEFTFNIQNLLDVGIVSPAYPVFTTKYNNEFVIEYINNSVKLRNSILSLKEGGTRFALSLKKLMRLQIPNISIKRQKDFIDIVHKFNNKIKNEKQILLLCEKQKQYLLDKLFI